MSHRVWSTSFAQILHVVIMSWEACEEFRPTTQNHNWILAGWMNVIITNLLQALQILLDEQEYISVFLFLHLSVNDVSCKWNRDGYLISRSILPVLWIRQFHYTLCKILLLIDNNYVNVYVFVHLKFVLCCTKWRFSDSQWRLSLWDQSW